MVCGQCSLSEKVEQTSMMVIALALNGMGVVSFILLQLEVRRTNPWYQQVGDTLRKLIKTKHSVSTNITFL